MNNKLILSLCMMMFCLSFAVAVDYLPHKQNTDLEFSITSNNATACNVTGYNSPISFISLDQEMTKTLQTFNATILSGNFTTLGSYCFNVVCTDGINKETGNICREVTPSGNSGISNIALVIILIIMIYAITFISFFGKNIPLSILSGMMMTFFGVWIIRNGIVIYRDNLTNYFGYVTLAIGAIIALWAAIEWLDDIL